MNNSSLKSFCKRLPKAELHAHLNGSLSEATLRALYARKHSLDTVPSWADVVAVLDNNDKDSSSLDQCFQLFDIAHAVTINPEAVYLATKDVITEFAEDGVVYLELRTTPRSVDGVMSKMLYIDSVVKAINEIGSYLVAEKKIIVKLLISINRREGHKAACENLNEAIEAHKRHPGVIVGVDLSGNPSEGHFVDDFSSLFIKARFAGLKVALHCAEIPNGPEVQAMLDFGADRLGHGTCIHPSMKGSEILWNKLLHSKVPLEVCLTSNVKCKTVTSFDAHHIRFLLPLEHPIAISTDDKGVFGTSLSNEYEIIAKTFKVHPKDLCKLAGMSIDASFASTEEKTELTQKLLNFQDTECATYCIQ